MVRYAFRMDDITPDMSWGKFESFVALFREYGIRPLLGVVPDNRDETLAYDPPRADFWARIRALAAEGWPVAQHGYQHLTLSHDGGLLRMNRHSEFCGLGEAEQLARITAGQEILRREGLATDIWMAPAHAYDRLTLRALRTAGFRHVTDGLTLYPYEAGGLKFIPCQMGRPRRMPAGHITICIHANKASEGYLESVRAFVTAQRKNVVPFSVLLAAPPRNYVNRYAERLIVAGRSVVHGLRERGA
jgi:predicted deacetylase